MNWLAQTTQPWLWTNMSSEHIALAIGIWVGVAVAVVIGLFRIWDIFADKFWTSRKNWKARQIQMEIDLEELKDKAEDNKSNIKTIAQAASSTPTPAAVQARVDQIAAEPSIDIEPKDKL